MDTKENTSAKREIKFKVWNPTYGMYDTLTLMEMTTFVNKPESGVKVLESCYPPETVFLQFTGLKDKNGKEIYEGDIVRKTVLGSYGGVLATDTQAVQYIGCSFHPMFYHNPDYLEVIGNIYENPDLLK